MTHYTLPGLTLESPCFFPSFGDFSGSSPADLPRCTLTFQYAPPPRVEPLYQIDHPDFSVQQLPQGWLYTLAGTTGCCLFATPDHRILTAYLSTPEPDPQRLLPLLRTALECASIPQGVLSLHSSCVVYQDQGLCFTAPSGTGKSTRAMSWQSGLGAKIISGDRPSLKLGKSGVTVSGAPWDGKEQIFVNRSVPLRAICCIRRGSETMVRKLSPAQSFSYLSQQCFIPMWDTEAAATVMLLLQRLVNILPVYRVTCGPDEGDAARLRDILFYHPEQIKEAQRDMKIKQGFILKNIAGEHIVMPTGKNISAFDGTIVLNDVAAFVWQQLAESCSREELLEAILAEFDVDRARAETDLDTLLETLNGYQVIEEAV